MKKYCLIFCLAAASCSARASETSPASQPVETENSATTETPETSQTPPVPMTIEQKGDDFVDRFYGGELDPLYDKFSNRMMKAMNREQWKAAHAQITTGLGKETEVVGRKISKLGGMDTYRRQAKFENTGEKLFEVLVVFSADGMIEGFSVSEPQVEAESPHLSYKTKTNLVVPWEGNWNVVWGGRTVEKNYHAKTKDQRFALDILVYDENGRSFRKDGKTNEDFFAFGKPVFAPGAGKVIAVGNDVEDNVPGTLNPKQVLGNHVIIDHGNGEFSFLAHFKKGTVGVKVGDEISQGQKLGECGNSGNSSEPHIHYHLQDTAELFKGNGLPIQFRSVTVNGTKLENVEIEQNQIVSQ